LFFQKSKLQQKLEIFSFGWTGIHLNVFSPCLPRVTSSVGWVTAADSAAAALVHAATGEVPFMLFAGHA
jgi:hypothetical protein